MTIIRGKAILTCGGSAPKAPPPPPPQPTEQDSSVVAARDTERRRRRSNPSNTFLTGFGSAPATPAAQAKTLLGS